MRLLTTILCGCVTLAVLLGLTIGLLSPNPATAPGLSPYASWLVIGGMGLAIVLLLTMLSHQSPQSQRIAQTDAVQDDAVNTTDSDITLLATAVASPDNTGAIVHQHHRKPADGDVYNWNRHGL